MLKIFGLPPTRSLRIVWLAEEMGLPYEKVPVNLREPSAEFLAVNPVGALPAIIDGDVQMSESIAIMLYLMERYGPTPLAVKPSEPAYPRYLQYLLFGEASLAMWFNVVMMARFIAPEEHKTNWSTENAFEKFSKRLEVASAVLAKSPYIAGDRFTAADISVDYAIDLSVRFGAKELDPIIKSYHERVTSRPAYRRATSATGGDL